MGYCVYFMLLFLVMKIKSGTTFNSESSSSISTDVETNSETNLGKTDYDEVSQHKPKVALLDLHAGCGAMSIGLCLGMQLSNFNLVTVGAS